MKMPALYLKIFVYSFKMDDRRIDQILLRFTEEELSEDESEMEIIRVNKTKWRKYRQPMTKKMQKCWARKRHKTLY